MRLNPPQLCGNMGSDERPWGQQSMKIATSAYPLDWFQDWTDYEA